MGVAALFAIKYVDLYKKKKKKKKKKNLDKVTD